MHRKVIIQTTYFLFVFFQPVQAKSFVVVGVAASFDQANIFCRNKFPNGRLATIKDEASKKALRSFLSVLTYPELLGGK